MKDWFDAFQVLQLGWVVALMVIIPLLVGLWLDRRFDSAPWLTLVGMVIGILAGTFGVVRHFRRNYSAIDAKHSRHKEEDE
ncbi:MAG: hypothetical protein A2Z04_00225 [Chloroflexi bacterium RBG_16_57_9]|nr:MAG: hypothetical protein A2Z04_00225 [Chloroflexi bacterium RBG_16_57_9]